MPGVPTTLGPLPSISNDVNALSSGNYDSALDVLRGASLPDIFSTPQFDQLRGLLGPGSDGGLSNSLAQLYGLGKQRIDANTGASVAGAKSDALQRGLEGSTIEGYEVGNANHNGAMANSDLLSSLFGMQNQNQGTLASYLFGGLGQQSSNYLDLLHQALGLYQNAGDTAGNVSLYREGLGQARDAASQAANSQMISSAIGAGGALGGAALKYGMLGPGGALIH